MRVSRTIIVGLEPTGIAATDDAVWVADDIADNVQRIDPRTNRKAGRPIKVGTRSPGGGRRRGAIWVANFREDTVSRIDPQGNRSSATIRVGNGPAQMAFGEGACGWRT